MGRVDEALYVVISRLAVAVFVGISFVYEF